MLPVKTKKIGILLRISGTWNRLSGVVVGSPSAGFVKSRLDANWAEAYPDVIWFSTNLYHPNAWLKNTTNSYYPKTLGIIWSPYICLTRNENKVTVMPFVKPLLLCFLLTHIHGVHSTRKGVLCSWLWWKKWSMDNLSENESSDYIWRSARCVSASCAYTEHLWTYHFKGEKIGFLNLPVPLKSKLFPRNSRSKWVQDFWSNFFIEVTWNNRIVLETRMFKLR